MKQFAKREDQGLLSFGKKANYGVGGLIYMLLANGVGQLAVWYNVIFKVDALVVGSILLLPRLWDAITDPLMGHISDNTRSRWGRRRPYILIGGILSGIFFSAMLLPPQSLSENGLNIYLLVTSVLFFTAFTVFTVSYNALGLEMSTDYHERSRVMAFRAYFYSFGTLIAFWGLWFATRSFFPTPIIGLNVTGILFGLIAVLATCYVFFTSREQEDIQKQDKIGIIDAVKFTFTSRPFLILTVALVVFDLGLLIYLQLISYVNIYYVFGGDIAAAAILGGLSATTFGVLKLFYVPMIAKVGTRFGKEKTFGFGLISGGLGMILTWFFYTPNYPYLQLALGFLYAFSFPTFEIFPQAIMADICNLDEMEHGSRREGMFGASMGFATKLAMSASPFIVGLILTFIGFDPNFTVQPDDVIFQMRIFQVVIPGILITAAGILIFAIKLPESKVREVRAILEKRHAQQQTIN